MFFSLNFLLIGSTIVFLLGVVGLIVNKRNLLLILISIELMLVSVNLNFICFSVYLDDIIGQIFSIYVLTIAAAESAIGLSIFTVYYRDKHSLMFDNYILGKG